MGGIQVLAYPEVRMGGKNISNHNLGQGHEISLLERPSDGMKFEPSIKNTAVRLPHSSSPPRA